MSLTWREGTHGNPFAGWQQQLQWYIDGRHTHHLLPSHTRRVAATQTCRDRAAEAAHSSGILHYRVLHRPDHRVRARILPEKAVAAPEASNAYQKTAAAMENSRAIAAGYRDINNNPSP